MRDTKLTVTLATTSDQNSLAFKIESHRTHLESILKHYNNTLILTKIGTIGIIYLFAFIIHLLWENFGAARSSS